MIGVDVDEPTVERLRNGESRVNDVTDAERETALAEGIEFTTDHGALADVDGVSICVPTPLRKSGLPDLSFVVAAAERLADVVPLGCTVVLESTVYLGATEEVVGRALTENGANVVRTSIWRSHPSGSTRVTRSTVPPIFRRCLVA